MQTTPVREWDGGERYGDENDHYFAEYRGTVTGQRPGDRVEVWFSGLKLREGLVTSERFSYRVRDDQDARVLVLADEDYRGVNPTYPAGTNAPRYAAQYVDALGPTGSARWCGTSTRTACRTTSACSATSTRSSGTWATTG